MTTPATGKIHPDGYVALDAVAMGAPYVLRAGEAQHYLAHGGLRSVLARSEDTHGDLGIFVNSGGPSRATIPHYHRHTTEFIYVLEGTTRVWLEDKEGDNRLVDDLQPGDFVLLPVGWVHAWAFTGTRNRYLAANSPGGFEKALGMLNPEQQTSLKDLRAMEETVDVVWLPEWDFFQGADAQYAPVPMASESGD
ncbi:quercetin 2,3-dioxygenase [Microbacterium sp. A93]|uniref:quercetin 2,3-dioxygenase n=1 Tax=Microbacterium sp. A93 TaxID=3450716 RepID=UPI003F43D164